MAGSFVLDKQARVSAHRKALEDFEPAVPDLVYQMKCFSATNDH